MPKLLLHVACEKVIIDRVGLPSIINIFRTMNFQQQDAPLPVEAVAPIRWSILTMWTHPPEENGLQFIQRVEIIKPNGELFGTGTDSPFTAKGDDEYPFHSKNYIEVLGLPVGQLGPIKVRVWLKDVPDSTAEYEFILKQVPKENDGKASPDKPAAVN